MMAPPMVAQHAVVSLAVLMLGQQPPVQTESTATVTRPVTVLVPARQAQL